MDKAKTHTGLSSQVEAVRTRLEELGYRLYSQSWTESKTLLTRRYAKADTGLGLLLVTQVKDAHSDEVTDWHVYKEVSTSGKFAEYLAAIS